MHNSILSKRNHASHTRTLVLAAALAENLNIDAAKVSALTPKAKDKDVRLMMQREAVADLLDDIALALGIDVPASGSGEIEPADKADSIDANDTSTDADAGNLEHTAKDSDQESSGNETEESVDGADQSPAGQASSADLPGPVIEE